MPVTEDQRRELLQAAAQAAAKAYAPYSRFRVGAAVLGKRLHVGANIENAAYSATLCAERVALSSALLDDDRDLLALAIATPDKLSSQEPGESLPCGTCRQWLAELAPGIEVVIALDGPIYTLADLLPHHFRLNSNCRSDD